MGLEQEIFLVYLVGIIVIFWLTSENVWTYDGLKRKKGFRLLLVSLGSWLVFLAMLILEFYHEHGDYTEAPKFLLIGFDIEEEIIPKGYIIDEHNNYYYNMLEAWKGYIKRIDYDPIVAGQSVMQKRKKLMTKNIPKIKIVEYDKGFVRLHITNVGMNLLTAQDEKEFYVIKNALEIVLDRVIIQREMAELDREINKKNDWTERVISENVENL